MGVIVCHGGMFSGKSDMAMNLVRSYMRSDLKVSLFQPKENTRDIFREKPVWYTRSGGDEMNLLPARWYSSPEKILEIQCDFDVFGFEEFHMYNKNLLDVIKKLHNSGKFIVLAGLDYYFNGEPTKNFSKLKELRGAIFMKGVGALCQDCLDMGNKNMASRTQRLLYGKPESYDAPKIIVEGTEGYDYKPICFEHWQVNSPTRKELIRDYKENYLIFKKSLDNC